MTTTDPRPKYEPESFDEWRWRLGEWRVRREEKVAALQAEFDAAPVIPALRIYPGSPQEIRRCRELGGVLHEGPLRGRWQSPEWYFVNPTLWEQAKKEASEAFLRGCGKRTSEGRKKRFVKAILSAYPKIDKEEAEEIAEHQFETGGVATSKLPLSERVRLAVRAYLRHCDDDYADFLESASGDETGNPEYHTLREIANEAAEDEMEELSEG